jgi:hypothetical protein
MADSLYQHCPLSKVYLIRASRWSMVFLKVIPCHNNRFVLLVAAVEHYKLPQLPFFIYKYQLTDDRICLDSQFNNVQK